MCLVKKRTKKNYKIYTLEGILYLWLERVPNWLQYENEDYFFYYK